jgi:DNA-directed RNA polymerase specialized sigma subunit
MPNLLCRFEALRSDKTLLTAKKMQLDLILDYYGENDERVCGIRTSIKTLEDRLSRALAELDQMVEAAKDPREACRLSDERLFLTYRYLHDMTMEQTAEAMHVSRDTVYRIRRRIVARNCASQISAQGQ